MQAFKHFSSVQMRSARSDEQSHCTAIRKVDVEAYVDLRRGIVGRDTAQDQELSEVSKMAYGRHLADGTISGTGGDDERT